MRSFIAVVAFAAACLSGCHYHSKSLVLSVQGPLNQPSYGPEKPFEAKVEYTIDLTKRPRPYDWE